MEKELQEENFNEVIKSLKQKYMKDILAWAKFGQTPKGERLELKYQKFFREVSFSPTETEKQKLEKLIKSTDERVGDYKKVSKKK
jgi:hypothetical protein